jgi:hypothetical protein
MLELLCDSHCDFKRSSTWTAWFALWRLHSLQMQTQRLCSAWGFQDCIRRCPIDERRIINEGAVTFSTCLFDMFIRVRDLFELISL